MSIGERRLEEITARAAADAEAFAANRPVPGAPVIVGLDGVERSAVRGYPWMGAASRGRLRFVPPDPAGGGQVIHPRHHRRPRPGRQPGLRRGMTQSVARHHLVGDLGPYGTSAFARTSQGQPFRVSIQSVIADQIWPSHSGSTMCLWLVGMGIAEIVPVT